MYFSWLRLQRVNADYITDTTESCSKISIDNSLPSMLRPLHFFNHKKLSCMSFGHSNWCLYTVLTSILCKTFHSRFAMRQLKDGLTSKTGRSWDLLTQYILKTKLFYFPKEVQFLTEFICSCGPRRFMQVTAGLFSFYPDPFTIFPSGCGGICTTIPQHPTLCQRQGIRTGWPM